MQPPQDDTGRTFADYTRDLVHAAMLMRGASRADIVARTGITEATLRRRLNGGDFTAGELGRIAGALKMTVSELLRAEDFLPSQSIQVEGSTNVINVIGDDAKIEADQRSNDSDDTDVR